MDHLRSASVAAGEAGGITQKLSAFAVNVGDGKKAVFVDTPGHAAFSSMRSHGANATDIVILVVALDDGVAPQTVEAARMALEAKCTIVVALNKVDRIPAADRQAAKQRVLSQLMDIGIATEEFGGDVFAAEISGKTGEGVKDLLEGLILQADMLELSAPAEGFSEATVLDARFEKGRGVVADCLVRWGKLSVGDSIVVGTAFGNVKSMTDDRGGRVNSAGPSTAVQLLGLRALPSAGQELLSVDSEDKARRIAERRIKVESLRKLRQPGAAAAGSESATGEVTVRAKVSSTDGKAQPIVVSAVDTVGAAGHLSAEEVAVKMIEEQGGTVDKEALAAEALIRNATINAVLKADGIGTLEALQKIVASVNERSTDATVRVIAASVGTIVKSDIELVASAKNPNIFAFNVGLSSSSMKHVAKQAGVEIVSDTVIYRLEDDMIAKLENMMPKLKTVTLEVRANTNYACCICLFSFPCLLFVLF
jgi:translation initiation factor IF-2